LHQKPEREHRLSQKADDQPEESRIHWNLL
jgi:hypothetical protein